MKYTLPITPIPAPRMTQSDRWRNPPRKCVANYFLFRDLLNIKIRELNIEKLPPTFDIIFFLPMPKSWSTKKRKEFNRRPHQQRPDRDNLLKAFQDALTGEDNYIFGGGVWKFWTDEATGFIILNTEISFPEI